MPARSDGSFFTSELAERVHHALRAAYLTEFAELLGPNVRWGAPDDPAPSCRNRRQVVQWHQRGKDAGVQGTVTEVVVVGDRILVGMNVAGRSPTEDGGATSGWQVPDVRNGKVTQIADYDSRAEAAARAGI